MNPTKRLSPIQRIRQSRRGGAMLLVAVFVVAVVGTLLVTWVLVNMFGHKQEARTPFVRLAELNEISVDAEPWGRNWPQQFDGWKATAGDKFYGGSSALPQSKLETSPWLKRLYAGYAFSIDYREARGHAYMLYDQGVTERVTKKPQAGACLHCHGSGTVIYRKAGLEAMGLPADERPWPPTSTCPPSSAASRKSARKPYAEVLAMLQACPDGTPGENQPIFPQAPTGGFTGEFAGQPVPEGHGSMGEAHPVSCIDCHDPATMGVRVTRPGLHARDGRPSPRARNPSPTCPASNAGARATAPSPTTPTPRPPAGDALVRLRPVPCRVLLRHQGHPQFPWGYGLKAEQLEKFWEDKTFPDGTVLRLQARRDRCGGLQGSAPGVRAVEPGRPRPKRRELRRLPHALRAGRRHEGHQPQCSSPMQNINNACQQCHHTEEELREKVATIQSRTLALMDRAAHAMTDMLDAIMEAKAAGASEEQLAPIYDLQRKAMWRLDYISSENSRGFHADQEAARILGESIDYSRQATSAALRLRAPAAPSTESLPIEPVQGVTPTNPPEPGKQG
jgi:nitrite reductase (cytochrome c-552)